MAKIPTYPTLFDEVLTISTTKLKQWGYLKPNQFKSGTVTWSRDGNITGRISIFVDTRQEPPYIELDYTYNGEPRNYKVNLTTIPSNLGRGVIHYFVCPHTGKRARKLYSIGGYFLHREAFTGCMYECQTYSKHGRMLNHAFQGIFAWDNIPKRYFRPYYRGEPTRTLKKILRKAKQADGVNLERLLRK